MTWTWGVDECLVFWWPSFDQIFWDHHLGIGWESFRNNWEIQKQKSPDILGIQKSWWCLKLGSIHLWDDPGISPLWTHVPPSRLAIHHHPAVGLAVVLGHISHGHAASAASNPAWGLQGVAIPNLLGCAVGVTNALLLW